MTYQLHEQTLGRLGVVRPVRYDPDTGHLDLLPPVPLASLEEEAHAVSQQSFLVEADMDLGGGWPYTMVVSIQDPDGARRFDLAADTRPDVPAATVLLEHWTGDMDTPGEWWTEARQWQELGFTTEEMLAGGRRPTSPSRPAPWSTSA